MSIEVRFGGRAIAVASGATVLESLERAGIEVSSSCRAGVCQACVMRAVDGPVPPRAQDGLRDSLRQSGHFLACVARPQASLVCEPADAAPFRGAVAIQEITPMAPQVVRVRLTRPCGLQLAPGQFVTLRREGVARSYSVASAAGDESTFDIHVRRIPSGRMSGWLHDEARPRDMLSLEGPKGDCTYRAEHPDEPLLLAGTGTGMAPLLAVAEEAVRRDHHGPITLLQGAAADDPYLAAEAAALVQRAANVRYQRVAAQLTELALASLSSKPPTRAYLCGNPAFVRDAKRRLFLAGLAMRRIHADPFIGTER
jgi:ferredoxin-NADP reductase/ferredoxin